MKVLQAVFALGCAAWMCGFCFFVAIPNVMVSTAIPQLPFGNVELAKWQLDIPQDSEAIDGQGEVHAGPSRVPHDGYSSPDAQSPFGVPLHGPIQHWGDTYDKPLLGCRFQDPRYISHTGIDLPVNSGTPVYATMSGEVVWAGDNGPWGTLVVVENNGYQTWFAHNESVTVQAGDIVRAGQVIAYSDSTGNSTGPHVHYGVKYFEDESDQTGTWINPELFFSPDDVISWVCSD